MISYSNIEALAQAFSPFPRELDTPTYMHWTNVHAFCAKDRGQPLTIMNLLHAMCSSNWTPDEAAKLLRRHGYPQNMGPYLPMLRVFSSETYYADITIWIYQLMRILKLEIPPHVTSLAMRAQLRVNAPLLAINLFKEVYANGQAGTETFTILFKALRMLGDLHQAREWFYVLAKEHGSRALHIALCEELIALFGAFGDVEASLMVYETMRGEGVPLSKKIYHALIGLCKTAELLPSAYSVMDDMKREMNPELRPDELTYTTIINACRAARDVEAEALMKDQKHLLQKELMTRKALRA